MPIHSCEPLLRTHKAGLATRADTAVDDRAREEATLCLAALAIDRIGARSIVEDDRGWELVVRRGGRG